ncbi:peptidase S24-like family protein [Escherichia coli 2-222-05_S1_C1]|nr:peptidase S24-like family protein [Escherichia coli 2-222-05_S1_C1]KDX72972.1 peptidase S24-like family protein [Escherichia coli 2-222-05_S1_C2]KDX77026.1 peptidase S24-like family protein [Escherichia coli 2-222-05_S1_C3]
MAVRDIRRFGCVVFGEPHYPEIWLRIDQGSAPSVSVTGARNDKGKERIQSLLEEICQAGFPSPATDYAEQELDLNSYCISRPAATFFLRASGESMNQAGVQNGDLLVVDRAEKPQHGDIVIAEIDGEFTVKRLLLRPRPALEPVSDSPEFRTLYPENICIFGIVTHVIHRTRELR